MTDRDDELRAAAVYGAAIVVLGMVGGIGESVNDLIDRLSNDRPAALHMPYTDLRNALQNTVSMLPDSELSDDFRRQLAALVSSMAPLLEAFAQADLRAFNRALPDIQEDANLVTITAQRLAERLGLAEP